MSSPETQQNAASEYLPSEHANGNGKSKAFDIVPHEEDCSAIAPRLRNSVRKDRELTDGAKVLFDQLTDDSFLYSVSPARGVVTKSKRKLAEELNHSTRSISRHASELEARRYIWLRTFWRGGFELTNWYIRGMAKPQMEMWNDADPSWGSSKANRSRRGSTVRGANGQFCPLRSEDPKNTELPIKSVVSGQPCPGATVKIVRGQRSPVSGDSGQPCPGATVKIVRGQRTAVTVDPGQNCPQTPDKNDRGPRTAVSALKDTPTDNGVLEGSTFKRSTGFNALKAGQGNGKSSAENIFLLDVRAMMELWRKGSAKSELANSGAWWRLAYRSDPDLIRRVLAETLRAVKERQIKTTPGQYAVDLWKRWDGQLKEA